MKNIVLSTVEELIFSNQFNDIIKAIFRFISYLWLEFLIIHNHYYFESLSVFILIKSIKNTLRAKYDGDKYVFNFYTKLSVTPQEK